MDAGAGSALITALAAIGGSIVGGLTSFATSLYTQRTQLHRDVLSREEAEREELYSHFIAEVTKLYIDSLDKALENPSQLIEVYSLVSQMRLVSGDKVLAAAEAVANEVVDSYGRPPIRFEDMYRLVRDGRADPLKMFAEACREERKTTLSRL